MTENNRRKAHKSTKTTFVSKSTAKYVIKKIYGFISVISTISIFSVFLCAFIGFFLTETTSDNDILLKQITKQLDKGEKIRAIRAVDIHGYGDDTIIVITDNEEITRSKNRVLILEKLTNGFLSKLVNPFGVDSEYITKYVYINDQDGWGLFPDIEYIGNISSETVKDIVISYEYKGSTYGAKEYVIIGYSDKEKQYQVVGTYPEVCKVPRLSTYNENGIITSSHFREMNSEIVSYSGRLQQYSNYCVPIWVKSRGMKHCLLVASSQKFSTECLINLYYPRVANGELVWDIFYSEEFDDFEPKDIFDNEKIVDLANSKVMTDYYSIIE